MIWEDDLGQGPAARGQGPGAKDGCGRRAMVLDDVVFGMESVLALVEDHLWSHLGNRLFMVQGFFFRIWNSTPGIWNIAAHLLETYVGDIKTIIILCD